MPITAYFHHKSIRRLVVAFATLFNGYQISKPDGTMVNVPIKWSSKTKWFTQLAENEDKDNLIAAMFPRMGFVISNISYDFNRKTSNLNKIAYVNQDDNNTMRKVYNPVPYNIDFELYIGAMTTDEGLQLIEQIVPFFAPSFNITIRELDDIPVERDIPFKLNTVTPDFQEEGSFDGLDIKIWTLSITAEANLYKNISNVGIIKHVIIDTYINTDVEEKSGKERYTADVDPETALITDEYQVLEDIEFFFEDVPKISE